MNQTLLFDSPAYLEINEARWLIAKRVLSDVAESGVTLETANDFGSGPGWFSKRLHDTGLNVHALEGRQDLVELGRNRAPGCHFQTFDFDGACSEALPAPRDFSLAFGILYHLENPLRSLRMMAKMTKNAMLLETMVIPGEKEFARVVRENPNETQGIQPLAMILTQSAIERAIWACGFDYLYKISATVEHADFQNSSTRHQRRCMWVMSRVPINLRDFRPLKMEEPQRADYWKK